jgi:hypothetical protein
MKKLLSLALVCLLFTACSVDLPPLESCVVGKMSPSGAVVDQKELLPTQLTSLSEWFSGLTGKWKFKIVDQYPSGIALILKHKKNRFTHANLRGDWLWVGNRYKVLTASERGALLAIVGENNLLPTFADPR